MRIFMTSASLSLIIGLYCSNEAILMICIIVSTIINIFLMFRICICPAGFSNIALYTLFIIIVVDVAEKLASAVVFICGSFLVQDINVQLKYIIFGSVIIRAITLPALGDFPINFLVALSCKNTYSSQLKCATQVMYFLRWPSQLSFYYLTSFSCVLLLLLPVPSHSTLLTYYSYGLMKMNQENPESIIVILFYSNN